MVCLPILASVAHPQEIYVDYGDDFPRTYAQPARYEGHSGTVNAKEDWQLVLDAKALLARSIHGIQPTQWYRTERNALTKTNS